MRAKLNGLKSDDIKERRGITKISQEKTKLIDKMRPRNK